MRCVSPVACDSTVSIQIVFCINASTCQKVFCFLQTFNFCLSFLTARVKVGLHPSTIFVQGPLQCLSLGQIIDLSFFGLVRILHFLLQVCELLLQLHFGSCL